MHVSRLIDLTVEKLGFSRRCNFLKENLEKPR